MPSIYSFILDKGKFLFALKLEFIAKIVHFSRISQKKTTTAD
jgi:hypothetical protein